MKSEEYLHILNLAAEVLKKGSGLNGFPAVVVEFSNAWKDAEINIRIKDEGAQQKYQDGIYEFSLNEPISKRQYESCVKHLEELIGRTKSFDE